MTDPIDYNAILCRYNEIALKGANRRRFEEALVGGMRRVIDDVERFRFVRERGRILIRSKDNNPFSNTQLQAITKNLSHVFGLASYSPGYTVDSTLEDIESAIMATFPSHYDTFEQSNINGTTIRYRMRARRSDKTFPLTSNRIEIHFAEQLLRAYPKLNVNLDQADIDVGVEVRENWSFIYYNRHPGPGGLPVGSSATTLVMLSGGIDSPVASYLTMKRGSPVHFLTFHSYPYTPSESIDKVSRLVRILNRFQKPGRLLACNLVDLQKAVRDRCISRYRTILYRRSMMRISAIIAKNLKAEAIITGDALGQVASQTVRNLNVINRATDMLVLRPLIGMDKQETTNLAREIGTLAISEENVPDSCTVFAPGSPSTGASLKRIMEQERLIDLPDLIEKCLSTVRLIDPQTGEDYQFEIITPSEQETDSVSVSSI